jgi:hypothetical protein
MAFPIRAPRHDEADKGAVERAIFTEFAARYRADIDIVSIRSGDPHRLEPDIIAKSTESDAPVACELIRLTQPSIDAFSRKFDKQKKGLYAGVDPAQLELLAYSDYLVVPWDSVLSRIASWFEATPVESSFTRAWLWNRANAPGNPQEGVWLWEEGRGISRFD